MGNIDELSKLTPEGKETYKRLLDLEDDGGSDSGKSDSKIIGVFIVPVNESTDKVSEGLHLYNYDMRNPNSTPALKPNTTYQVINATMRPIAINSGNTMWMPILIQNINSSVTFTTDANGKFTVNLPIIGSYSGSVDTPQLPTGLLYVEEVS